MKLQPDTDQFKQYQRLGQIAFEEKNFIEAFSKFSEYAKLMPHIAEPYWLKGNALAADKKYDRAIEEYKKAIKFKANPYPAKNVHWHHFFIRFNLASYCYNRGNAYAALGDHQNAIKDFDRTIEMVNGISHGVPERIITDSNYNKANSHYVLGQFPAAYEYFKSSGYNESSDANLGMGNSALMQIDLKEAENCYRVGIDKDPKQSAESCQTNLNVLQNLIRTLRDKPIESHTIEGQILALKVTNVRANIFVFVGNAGNYGNWGGGKSYCGIDAVVVNLQDV